ncbi:MAG: glycosyltransferase 87 family protein [Gemmataceae bacterium]|nr:glycosyltransferase 87 family protein [Gemmataceae bacterium]
MGSERLRRWWASRQPWEQWAAILWMAVVLIISARVLLTPRAGSRSVLPIYLWAAERWRTRADMYPGGDLGGELPGWRYAPVIAASMVPWNCLPLRLAEIGWRLLNVGVLLAGLFAWMHLLLPTTLTRTQRALLLILVLPMAVGNINNAQANALVLGLMLLGVAAVQLERWNLAATCLATGVLFKMYPLAVALLLTALYPRRFLWRLVAVIGVGLAIPFVMQDPAYVTRQYVHWLRHISIDDRSTQVLSFAYVDLQLLFRVWAEPIPVETYRLIELVAGAVMAILCLTGRSLDWPRNHLLNFVICIGCCWMTVLGPATESCTYILVAPAVAWAVVGSWRQGSPRWLHVLMVGAYGLLVSGFLAGWAPSLTHQYRTLGPQPLAGLILMAGLLCLAFRRPTEGVDAAAAAHPASLNRAA